MSPVGGIGINLAIQDAVATSNLLTDALRTKQLTLDRRKSAETKRAAHARDPTFPGRDPKSSSREC
jgi:2-polyprenyl-6-methoxyphenol hydroxylase-like FAD-dependent oxidoreductase